MNKERYIIYGAGKRGKGILRWLAEYADIIGFYDSNQSLWGG